MKEPKQYYFVLSLVALLLGSVTTGYAEDMTGLRVEGTDISIISTGEYSPTSIHLRADGYDSFINNMDGFVSNGSSGNGLLYVTGQTGISLLYGNAGSIGTEAMRITDTGNVGIGISNPPDLLTVHNYGVFPVALQVEGEYPSVAENGARYYMQRVRLFLIRRFTSVCRCHVGHLLVSHLTSLR